MSARDEYYRIINEHNRYGARPRDTSGYSVRYQEDVNSMLVSYIDSLEREIEELKRKLEKR